MESVARATPQAAARVMQRTEARVVALRLVLLCAVAQAGRGKGSGVSIGAMSGACALSDPRFSLTMHIELRRGVLLSFTNTGVEETINKKQTAKVQVKDEKMRKEINGLKGN